VVSEHAIARAVGAKGKMRKQQRILTLRTQILGIISNRDFLGYFSFQTVLATSGARSLGNVLSHSQCSYQQAEKTIPMASNRKFKTT